MRCLWVTRDLPYPATAGDVIYSSRLIEALSAAGAEVTVVCRDTGVDGIDGAGVRWHTVRSPVRSPGSSIVSKLPSIAHRYGARAMADALAEELRHPWDVILVDHIGAGWALPRIQEARRTASPRPALVYVSHNHETSTREAVARNAAGNPVRRRLLRLDAAKVAPLERSLVADADLVTVNTAEDEALYLAEAPRQEYLVVLPGYDERVVEQRVIDDSLPHRAVIVGSFDWIAKRANLEEFVEVADPLFAAAGAELVVIGRGPEAWLEDMRAKTRATTFTGFVESVTPYLDQARLGIVSERSGGGFKHKVLFYVFNRVPVAVLEGSVAGVPLVRGESMIETSTVEDLSHDVLHAMDDLVELQALQMAAFEACTGRFDWEQRGRDLFDALQTLSAR